MAGYSGTPLVKKLGIKEGMVVSFIGAPDKYEALLGKIPPGVRQTDRGEADFIHLFSRRESDLKKRLPVLKKRLKKTGALWISWPKGTSRIETDLRGDSVREMGLATGLVDIKICAVDEDWSGLKFVYRLKDRN